MSLLGVDSAMERIASAHEALKRQIINRFGGDAALISAANEIVLSAAQAVEVLEMDDGSEASDEQLSALEAIVAFDGSRPSFLVREDQVDLGSSFNTGEWKTNLAPFLGQLSAIVGCVGRVELRDRHVGTAFLVTPTLAITNRHVAQAIARFTDDKIALKPEVYLDFGREEWNGRQSFDRRTVNSVAFAGQAAIVDVDHRKLDLAALRVSSSSLAGDLGSRRLECGEVDLNGFQNVLFVGAVGYPAKPDLYVPIEPRSKFGDVLCRLLEGDGGAKRFAPGIPTEIIGVSEDVGWTVCHDATTLNGNSGSPLLALGVGGQDDAVVPAALHYGGDWGGERVNWAHLLTAVGACIGYGSRQTFAEFCRAEGVSFN